MANTPTAVPVARRSRRGAATAPSVADSGAARPRRSRSDGPGRTAGAASHAATSAAMPTANPIQARTPAGEHSRRRGRPRTHPRPRAAPTCSHGDLVADLVQRGRTDPTHVLEFIDRGERAVLGAVVDDGGSQHLTDACERSNSMAVAVLMLMRAPATVPPVDEPVAPTAPAAPPSFETTTWVPSVRGAARFRMDRSFDRLADRAPGAGLRHEPGPDRWPARRAGM